ncbi:methionine ABC transporter permease [Trueperella sp. zg.1013]|uniref:methionine ABC transporter permease n=2 Tax=Bacillati TaxID=1783272 RepID=UPI001C6E9709|nr:methionine ABC transporter permease [Trueperella sp. zg.1013]MBW9212697.1 ABC transporter permease [Trueperella sp. zg.1013]
MMTTTVNIEQLQTAVRETLYMTFFSLTMAVILGLVIGILLYCTQSDGLFPNRMMNRFVDAIVNILRAIPFIILLILVIPLTKLLVGSMLGAKAALPSLILASAPFFARMCVIAFQEVDKGTIEASKAMGATNWQIITKVLLPESLPAIVSGITVTGISLISYTAMAGAIGAGGLGSLAYLYGFARRNGSVLYTSTAIIIVIVLAIQWLGDFIVKRIDKR